MAWKSNGGAKGTWHASQFKADADIRAHDLFVSLLTEVAPGMPILSEEAAFPDGPRPSEYFLIDPLDGTASYAHGFPGFVTQVAVIRDGRPTLAAVYAPQLNLAWAAAVGGGAFLGGERLQVAVRADRLTVIDNYPSPRGVAAYLVARLPATDYVECGSIGLKACRVADGTADVFVKDVIVRDWDIAPADLIISEAGGWLTSLDGIPYKYEGSPDKRGVVVAADARLAARVLTLLASA